MSEEETGAQVTTPPTPDRKEDGFEPCPTCKQYSHSIGDDALARALMHFEAMTAHPVSGHPMGHVYDEATRDAAQVLIAAAKGCVGKEAVREAVEQAILWARDDKSAHPADAEKLEQRIEILRAVLQHRGNVK